MSVTAGLEIATLIIVACAVCLASIVIALSADEATSYVRQCEGLAEGRCHDAPI